MSDAPNTPPEGDETPKPEAETQASSSAAPSEPEQKDGPSRFPWPPVFLVAGVVLGFVLQHVLPFGDILDVLRPLGWFLVVAAIAWEVWAALTLKNAGTNLRPTRPALGLVREGPFAYSRNPIYLGNAAILIGLAMALTNGWFLLLAAAYVILINMTAIQAEEGHLSDQFGEDWEDYSSRTPRWVRKP